MQPFAFERATSLEAAQAAMQQAGAATPRSYLAGGTTLIDLVKLDVMRPELIVDINPLEATALGRIAAGSDGLRLGALARMAEAEEHPAVLRDYPALAQALQLAASPQLRNMASLGGNVLQRTRCNYFRDVSYSACNKRNPGSGCAALDGYNRMHAVLGVSDHCIASYPGDFAQALIAFDAMVEIASSRGARSIPIAKLHRLPADSPNIETTLQPDEVITGFFIPAGPWTRRSLFLKVRDRESYEFALASAAVGLYLDQEGTVRNARIALGGVASVPWRASEAEAVLDGQPLDTETVRAAAEAAFAGARPHKYNAFKIALGKETLIRALGQAATMEF